jgi:cysteinyl-tRNA synthetase
VSGKKFVKYWIHGGFLTMNKGKMSKSLGNVFYLNTLKEQGFSPLDYRYFILTANYRSPLDFTLENLQNAKNSYQRIKNILKNLEDDGKENKKYLKEFENAINDDLNMPKALSVLWELVRDEKAEGKYQTIKKMDEVFGLHLLEKEELKIPKEIKEIAEERKKAKEKKDWKKADELREELKKKGWNIKDTKESYDLEKI